MSEMAGIDAFDNVMDRLLDERECHAATKRNLNESRHELSASQQRVRDLERKLVNAEADTVRWKALVPEDVRAKAEQSDQIPF